MLPFIFSVLLLIIGMLIPFTNLFLEKFPFHSSIIVLILYVLTSVIFLTFFSSRIVMHLTKKIDCRYVNSILKFQEKNKMISYGYYLFRYHSFL